MQNISAKMKEEDEKTKRKIPHHIMKQKLFVVCRTDRFEPRRSDDDFVIIGKLSAWQISDITGEESG